MTGIQIPAALVPHAAPDTQLSRPALAIDKLAALMPVQEVSQGDVQSSTGETVQARQPNVVGPGGMDARGNALTSSTRETLSFAARAILDLFESGDAQPLQTRAPLLSTAPGAGNASAATLSAALATLVDQSGLFYESHVAQWVVGQRPLSALLQEPQAGRRPPPAPNSPAQPASPAATPPQQPAPGAGAPVALLPYGGPPAAPAPTPSAAILAELTRPTIFPLTTGVPAQPARGHGADAGSQAGQPGQPASASALPGQATPSTPAAEQRRAAHANAAAHAYQITAEVSHEGHHIAQAQRAAIIASWNAADQPAAPQQPDVGPPVHPASEGVVRQQLELLATQQFRWTVEAWPGMPVDWEVTREQQGEHSPTSADAATWSTRLRLNLPRLGHVDAVLTLGAHGLEARLVADDRATAGRLAEAGADFRGQLEAHGISLLNLNVSAATEVEARLDAMPAAQP
ncbi:flagellar hook-length control protein FliK [Cupriavidus sp.]|uniref:flagellar hook-length control protein FliK n=1 Tax=Cupriavidus sp. TaxID=1873897 RepID=UPI0028BD997F|nr:flagellar hook-length control protein FliK [Cupriavidus sp.]